MYQQLLEKIKNFLRKHPDLIKVFIDELSTLAKESVDDWKKSEGTNLYSLESIKLSEDDEKLLEECFNIIDDKNKSKKIVIEEVEKLLTEYGKKGQSWTEKKSEVKDLTPFEDIGKNIGKSARTAGFIFYNVKKKIVEEILKKEGVKYSKAQIEKIIMSQEFERALEDIVLQYYGKEK